MRDEYSNLKRGVWRPSLIARFFRLFGGIRQPIRETGTKVVTMVPRGVFRRGRLGPEWTVRPVRVSFRRPLRGRIFRGRSFSITPLKHVRGIIFLGDVVIGWSTCPANSGRITTHRQKRLIKIPVPFHRHGLYSSAELSTFRFSRPFRFRSQHRGDEQRLLDTYAAII